MSNRPVQSGISGAVCARLRLPLALMALATMLISCVTAPDAGNAPAAPAQILDLVDHLPPDRAAYFYVDVARNRELVRTVLLSFEDIDSTIIDLFLERTAILSGSIDGPPNERSIFAVGSGGYPKQLVESLLTADGSWQRSTEEVWSSAASQFQFQFLSNELIYSTNADLAQVVSLTEREATAGLPRTILTALPTHAATLYVRHPQRGFQNALLGRVQPIRNWVAFMDSLPGDEHEISGWVQMESVSDARLFTTLLRLALGALAQQLQFDVQETIGNLQVVRDQARISFAGIRVSQARLIRLATLLGPQP